MIARVRVCKLKHMVGQLSSLLSCGLWGSTSYLLGSEHLYSLGYVTRTRTRLYFYYFRTHWLWSVLLLTPSLRGQNTESV